MTMPKSKGRVFKVSGKDYIVSVSGGKYDEKCNAKVRISIQAQYGYRSYCQVRGLISRLRHEDHSDFEDMLRNSISITPSVVCDLIELAQLRGWNPEGSKATFQFSVTKATVDAFRKNHDNQLDSCESQES